MSLKDFLTSKVFFKQVAIALVIVVVVCYAMLKWLDHTTNHGQKIMVPDLNKMSVAEAEKALKAVNLDYIILDTVDFKKEYPPYAVVQQDPLANVNVKEKRKIYIKVNAGSYNDISLPDLVQKTLRQAEPTLKGAGLELGEVTYKPYLAKDIVLEMQQNGKKLKAGDKVKKASKIDLVLGDGETGYNEEDTTNDNAGGTE